VATWLVALGVCRRATAARSLAFLVTALPVGQRLRPAVVLRAWPSPAPVPARQGFKRLARAFDRPWLASAHRSPCLARAALALVPRQEPTHLALDGVRCGAWEVLVIGVVWDKRVLPVGWAVLPYPWPKRRPKPTACAPIRRVAAGWPVDRPVRLLADRGFPGRDLFRTLAAAGWGWTVRLGTRSLLTVDGFKSGQVLNGHGHHEPRDGCKDRRPGRIRRAGSGRRPRSCRCQRSRSPRSP